MSLEQLRDFLLWCAIINYGFLLFWVFIALFARDWMYGLVKAWFGVSPAQVDIVNYAGIATYKLAILIFNVVPYIALLLILNTHI
jgi:hypothetical protein